ncbi:hypothetical protein SAMN05216466_13540 [Paraburkholderia phenazinium]|uniref:Uncharacterized protein n=1 Tax=Paraburkholderia phenazinium TaxID=60549 RepID=A0A1G8NK88_9BURK|nr:hypothetical protein [Paraburkholderia phenazinium]SDI80644.1 hypothetical protein SAMN05216466_13540 [Paraburkholderia phenazinium]
MHAYYSLRAGSNPNPSGLPLADVIDLFTRVFALLRQDGYFDEAFGFTCVDAGDVDGKVRDVGLEILLNVRKKGLWPIEEAASMYKEDDLFDMIEFLFQYVSKPVDGTMHSYAGCGMHWETFNKRDGQQDFREKINAVLSHYEKRFALSENGQVLHEPESGFEPIFNADIPSDDANVSGRVAAATLQYRRHGATIADRRQAVRELADVLEYLRPKMKELITSKDEADLFNIANNFGVRHHNEKQKTGYDASLWLSWMFYYYLSTIHVVLRKMRRE